MIHTVKSLGVVNEAEVDVFLEFSCFFYDPADVGSLISGSSAFSKFSLYIWKFSVQVLLKPRYKIKEIEKKFFEVNSLYSLLSTISCITYSSVNYIYHVVHCISSPYNFKINFYWSIVALQCCLFLLYSKMSLPYVYIYPAPPPPLWTSFLFRSPQCIK